jgi:hypothetical protein
MLEIRNTLWVPHYQWVAHPNHALLAALGWGFDFP